MVGREGGKGRLVFLGFLHPTDREAADKGQRDLSDTAREVFAGPDTLVHWWSGGQPD